ncbi:sodium channel protein Nach-like, partial [Spodoptera litura]|uniref:Sodium channel protein Nach-like n=1 Tax=Spodoptera litura TaxID=69820 RepID=A0A9J7EUG9_SPOLT
MPMDKELKSTLVEKTKSFCKHCTLHGVYYFYKASSWSAHLLWAMIIAASMALCCFLGHMIWEKFVIDPTLTVVETTHYSMVNIPFPAVTICDTDNVFLPKTKEITDLLILRGYNNTEIDDFYKSFNEVKHKNYVPEPYVRKMHSLLEDLGYSLKILLDMFKRPCSNITVECNWRSKPFNCSEMFHPLLTIVGHCCQFDIPYFKEHADNQTNFISGLDSTEALDVIVNGQSSNGHSVLYVYDYKEKVTLVDSFFSLTPQSFFDVNIYVWAIDSSSYVKALPLSGRKCILDT